MPLVVFARTRVLTLEGNPREWETLEAQNRNRWPPHSQPEGAIGRRAVATDNPLILRTVLREPDLRGYRVLTLGDASGHDREAASAYRDRRAVFARVRASLPNSYIKPRSYR
jgi:hypothetical protein